MTGTAEGSTAAHEGRPAGSQNQVDEKTWALLAHLSSLSGVFTGLLGAILGPMVVWLVGKEKHPFIDRHGKEALNFGITVVLAGFVLGLVAFFVAMPMFMFALTGMFAMLLLIPLFLAVFVFWLVFVITAAVKASNGQEYRYPVSLRIVK